MRSKSGRRPHASLPNGAQMHCQSCGAKVADGVAFCGSCGRPIVGYSVNAPLAGGAAGGTVFSDSPGSVGVVPMAAPVVTYAGFWMRFCAALIDGIILGIPFAVIYVIMIASALPTLMRAGQVPGGNPMLVLATILPRVFLLLIVFLAGSWLYWAKMESSSWQATLGKKALGIYVTDMTGNRVTFGKASGRFFAGRGISIVPGLGGLYYLVDCIMAGFTERKQALHDIIANCLVLRKA